MKITKKSLAVAAVLAFALISSTFAQTVTRTDIDGLDRVIREVSTYLNERVPRGDKVAFVSARQTFPALTEYVIENLIENAVNDRSFAVIDRAQLDAVRNELQFQTSGEVSDESVRSLGRILGAKTIVTVTVSQINTLYRFGVRALEVESAQIQGQINRNIPSGPNIEALAGQQAAATTTTASTQTATRPATATAQTTTQTTQAATTNRAETPIQGTMVPGNSLGEKLAWLNRSADSHNTYIMEINADERIAPHTFNYQGAINITIVLRGDEQNRTLRLSGHGTMFTVNRNVTFILDNNVTLHGHEGNNNAMVVVNGGTFRMRGGATITGNSSNAQRNSSHWGGAVRVHHNSHFQMTGGIISGNSHNGVRVGGRFTLSGGSIINNSGGGVRITGGTFTMTEGTISDNRATSGGGVGVDGGTFTMRGGTITNNRAWENGGGVWVKGGTFTKTGGTITGHNSDQNNGNRVRDADGNILARRGHAVFFESNRSHISSRRKETTVGPDANLSADFRGNASGAWDQ